MTETAQSRYLKLIAVVIAPAVVAIIALPGLYARAYVLHALWGWYVVPSLRLSALPTAFAFGILLTINVAVARPAKKKSELDYDILPLLGLGLFRSGFTLGLGWVGTWFIN